MNKNQILSKVRQSMQNENIDVYIIPNNDPHNNEYLPEKWRFIEHITGFTGSAATLVIGLNDAWLWTDSRYFIQAEKQLEGSSVKFMKLKIPHTPEYIGWISKNFPKDTCIGINGEFWSMTLTGTMETAFKNKGIHLKISVNLTNGLKLKSTQNIKKAFILDEEFSGKTTKCKMSEIRKFISENKADAYIINTLDEIAWTLNIRANDIPYNPFLIGFLVIFKTDSLLFTNPEKVGHLSEYFKENRIKILKYEMFYEYLSQLRDNGIKILVSMKINARLYELIKNCNVKVVKSFIEEQKAIKNSVEINGMKKAHLHDGVALVKFLFWIENSLGKITMSELSLSEKLESFRAEQPNYFGLSFATIAGFNEHGAIVHYCATKESDSNIEKDGLLLLDSGGHYLNGTTDITRTIPIATPTDEQKTNFTLVLKGFINLSRQKFPQGTKGHQLDTIARAAMWQHGVNFGHGTGHGVGAFGAVHEGPQGISPRCSDVELKPKMTVTIEPGVYIPNEYGIRIENVVFVENYTNTLFGNFMKFETLTFCPIDLRLIDVTLLENHEKTWLNEYHKRVNELLHPFLEEDEQLWLEKNTTAI